MTDEARDGGRERQATSDGGAEGVSAGAQGNDNVDENEQIRIRAYERWLARGGQGGDEREDWLEAEREYRERAQGRQAAESRQQAGEPRRETSRTRQKASETRQDPRGR